MSNQITLSRVAKYSKHWRLIWAGGIILAICTRPQGTWSLSWINQVGFLLMAVAMALCLTGSIAHRRALESNLGENPS